MLKDTDKSKENKLSVLLEVLIVSTKLGMTSFGGPIAHLGYFHNEYIQKRKWMDERSYADLVALCQFLPGPASSQVGIGIGTIRAGLLGGIIAWIGFTMPSIILMIAFAYLLKGFNIGDVGWIHGLKIVAVAIVAHAVLTMGQKLVNDHIKGSIAIIAASIGLIWQSAYSQVVVILTAGLIGLIIYKDIKIPRTENNNVNINKAFSISCIILFFLLLVALPILRELLPIQSVKIIDSFYRSGSLVFGGGHVVLPLLEMELVPTGWVSQQDFLAGYGATQAMPGPLFTFAAYLGTMINGITGAIFAIIGVFLPSFLLVIGVLPFWNKLRSNIKMQGALAGINAAVVGILLGALYNPLWITAIQSSRDFVLAIILFGLMLYWKLPPWIIVIIGILGGMIL